jgi:G:T/U-mismatch repair DNA glycosylase
LDSNIEKDSIIINDFGQFFEQHRAIEHIFFNGNTASQEYSKRVLPYLKPHWQSVPCTRLPSSSPAMASLNLEQKILAWQVIKRGIKY